AASAVPSTASTASRTSRVMTTRSLPDPPFARARRELRDGPAGASTRDRPTGRSELDARTVSRMPAWPIIDRMAIEVRISDPVLLGELISAFLKSGCLAIRSSADSCRVLPLDHEALPELVFFVRAWQLARPTVSAVVIA